MCLFVCVCVCVAQNYVCYWLWIGVNDLANKPMSTDDQVIYMSVNGLCIIFFAANICFVFFVEPL